jgi:glycosyltransferase involved in cell wall biosynthesis
VILGMLAERPAVSTGPEGVEDLIEDGWGAIVSPENDPEALATVLRRYQGDPELVRREGALGARKAVERFDAAAVAERAERLLEPPGGER